MSTFSLTNAKLMMGGYNISGFHNSLGVTIGPEMLDDTVFGTSGTRSFKPGLKNIEAEMHGFWDTAQDEPMFLRISASREVMSFAAVGEAEGDIAFSSRWVNGQYNPGGTIGELLAYDFMARSANTPMFRGRVLAAGSKAVDGNGTGVNIGAALSTQRIYSALHVFGVATDVTVTIESDDNSGFTTPTTRLTHTTMTAIGADWQEDVGPVTDTWWRATWDVTGGAADIYVVFGIL